MLIIRINTFFYRLSSVRWELIKWGENICVCGRALGNWLTCKCTGRAHWPVACLSRAFLVEAKQSAEILYRIGFSLFGLSSASKSGHPICRPSGTKSRARAKLFRPSTGRTVPIFLSARSMEKHF